MRFDRVYRSLTVDFVEIRDFQLTSALRSSISSIVSAAAADYSANGEATPASDGPVVEVTRAAAAVSSPPPSFLYCTIRCRYEKQLLRSATTERQSARSNIAWQDNHSHIFIQGLYGHLSRWELSVDVRSVYNDQRCERRSRSRGVIGFFSRWGWLPPPPTGTSPLPRPKIRPHSILPILY